MAEIPKTQEQFSGDRQGYWEIPKTQEQISGNRQGWRES
jgi:hypothetical protein